MAQATKPAQNETQEGSPANSSQAQYRAQVDAISKRLHCHENVAKALLASTNEFNREAKLSSIRSALHAIEKCEGFTGYEDQIFYNYRIAEAFVANPEKISSDLMRIITFAGGNEAFVTFQEFQKEPLANIFLSNPDALIELAASAGKMLAFDAFKNLSNETAAGIFTRFTHEILEFAKESKENTGIFLRALSNEPIAESFSSNPQAMLNAFRYILQQGGARKLYGLLPDDRDLWLYRFTPKRLEEAKKAQAARKKFVQAFSQDPQNFARAICELPGSFRAALESGTSAQSFIEAAIAYAQGKAPLQPALFYIHSCNRVAIELGRPLDDLHDEGKEAERSEYLKSLDVEKLLALLCSDPSFFYTSSNNMLFDSLKEALHGKAVSSLLLEYDASFDSQLGRNFIFRAITYGRLYGSKNSLLGKSELGAATTALLSPISSETFDPEYYFLLANGLHMLLSSGLIKPDAIISAITDRLLAARQSNAEDSAKIARALEYVLWLADPSTDAIPKAHRAAILELSKASVFNPKLYQNEDGIVTTVQIFDREDTEKDHWQMTQEWFQKRLGQPRVGESGELIYQKGKKRLILFMGESEEVNQSFITRQLEENKNLIFTFRGHSYSLEDSFPSGIFQNREGNVLCILGSCGSSSDVAGYLTENPRTNLSFVSNTSTGRGQVTNQLVSIFMALGKPIDFEKVKADSSKAISDSGGDVSTLSFSSNGECLLKYAQRE